VEPDTLRLTELRYCRAEDDEVVTTVAEADVTALAQGWPVREFAWHPHQGNYPGWLWTATTGSFVGYESLLERDRVLLADFDPAVVGIVSQPFWVSGPDEACGGAARRHAPDYLLSLRDGCQVVVDVKPAAMCDKPEVAVVLAWTGRVCRARGWRYEVFHGEDPIRMSNLRFLAMGRRSMFLDPDDLAAVQAVGAAGVTLADIEATVTGVDRLDVRACALALLWRQVWVTELGRPLSSGSVISAIRAEEQPCPISS
jgi:hypothetical protein